MWRPREREKEGRQPRRLSGFHTTKVTCFCPKQTHHTLSLPIDINFSKILCPTTARESQHATLPALEKVHHSLNNVFQNYMFLPESYGCKYWLLLPDKTVLHPHKTRERKVGEERFASESTWFKREIYNICVRNSLNGDS